jgi:Flp pilus assembly protein CpaB
MKSKNMTLMVVAIGCGLVAAFLTARLSGGSGPEMIDVWVAKKEITVGTTLPADEKELENFIVQAKMAKASLPPDVVASKDDLKGKRLNRTLRQGNFFAPADVGADSGIKLPEGMRQYAIRTDVVKSAGGSVDAGKHVDVLFTESLPNGKRKTGVILQNVLILQVDQHQRPTEGPTGGRQQVSSVSLAVTPKQGMILSTAEERGQVKLLLRDENSTEIAADQLVIENIPGFDKDPKENQATPAVVPMITIVVAKAEVPLNEFITADNFPQYFTTREVPAEYVSPKTIKDPLSLREKYIVKAIEPDQHVFSTMLGDAKVEIKVKEVIVVKEVSPAQNGTYEQLPAPREMAQEKPSYPRKFTQVINGKLVWWKETAEGVFERIDGNTSDLKDLPNSGSIEKKEEKKAQTAGNLAV